MAGELTEIVTTGAAVAVCMGIPAATAIIWQYFSIIRPSYFTPGERKAMAQEIKEGCGLPYDMVYRKVKENDFHLRLPKRGTDEWKRYYASIRDILQKELVQGELGPSPVLWELPTNT